MIQILVIPLEFRAVGLDSDVRVSAHGLPRPAGEEVFAPEHQENAPAHHEHQQNQ